MSKWTPCNQNTSASCLKHCYLYYNLEVSDQKSKAFSATNVAPVMMLTIK